MSSFVLLLLSVLLSQAALAELGQGQDPGNPLAATPTSFDSLSAAYDLSQMPLSADLLGWYSGRCYFVTSKDQAVAAVLVTQASTDGTLKIIAIGHGNVPEDYYDHLTPQIQNETSSYVASTIDQVTVAQAVEGSLASIYTPGNLEYRMRKSPTELDGRMVVTQDVGSYKKGDTYVMCRFFIKVTSDVQPSAP